MQDNTQQITQSVYEDPEIVDGYIKRNNSKKYDPHYVDIFISHLNGNKVLDLGCGPGRDVQELNNKGLVVTGLDLSNEMIKRAKSLDYRNPQPNFLVGSMLKLNELFENNSFDGIWASASLLHIRKSEIDLVIDGIRNILTRDGIAMISLKGENGTELVEEDKYGKKMLREFTFWIKEEFVNKMNEFGFELIHYENKGSESKIKGKQVEFHNFIFKASKESQFNTLWGLV